MPREALPGDVHVLIHKVVRALVDLVVSIDLSDEEQIPSDFGSDLLNDVAGAFGNLTPDETRELVAIVSEIAQGTQDPVRRNAILELPETLGLTDE
jgi:hypothetical protein